ncbi:SDR family oxidoreductase [Streptomyces sp. MBT49]|uniref:NAD-dependent epimerase/dehydratase family protein n=1 Tax=Streptomyces TaxID=1883 RepID=UPI00190CA4D1|nr:SDR family oxidoreductase [Streptomyces sp. MBT49]MBK3627811.1 SDR family oxidoreductase [Streptomyces sp. MBT49]
MRVLVTGGAGYLGSTLVPVLLSRGHRVLVLDSLLFGAKGLLSVLPHPHLELLEADVRDESVVRGAVSGADAVVNLAAIVGYPACLRSPSDAEAVNVGAARCIASCVSSGQILVQASTGSIYGKVSGPCTEETPTSPRTHYAKTKAEAEKIMLGSGGASLRFATLFGVSPRMRLDLLVNNLAFQAVHAGSVTIFQPSAVRTFLHVSDAARAVIMAIDRFEIMSGRVCNIGDDDLNHTKLEVAEEIRRQRNFRLRIDDSRTDPDERDYRVSYRCARELGLTAKVTLTQGVEEVLRAASFMQKSDTHRIEGA